MATRMREYAVHADYAQSRKYADADANEKRVGLDLFLILSATHIIVSTVKCSHSTY